MKTLAYIWQRKRLFGILVSAFLLQQVSAQDIQNTGQIHNTNGLIRVKGQTQWAPDTVQGTLELYGTNQSVPAKLYRNLVLSGSGLNTTVGGDFSVLGNLSVSSAVVLNVQNGYTLTLGDTIFEQGYVQGRIRKSVSLSTGTSTSDFGQIGSTISWLGQQLGLTVLTRLSGTASTGFGQQSIRRAFDIVPTWDSRLNATFVFKYAANELGVHNPHALELWRSIDNGLTWRRQGGVVDTAQRTITKSGVLQFSRWTAADTLHLLGPAAYEWMPDNIQYVSGDSQKAYRHFALQQPLVVRLKDYFGNWLEGDTISFGFTGSQNGAALSAAQVVTDSNGYASTTLTLGDSLGTYSVLASNAKIPGRTVRFNAATTIPSAAAVMQITSGNNQPAAAILTTLSPFVLTVVDTNALPVAGDTVRFTIYSVQTNAASQLLSDTMVITGADGRASTTLKLGTKVGVYTVQATSRGLVSIQFTARAIAGAPAITALASGNGQMRSIDDTLRNPFVVFVTDTCANPVFGVHVKFSVTSYPIGAVNYHLSADSAITDSSGNASVQLVLGTKPGVYTVTATPVISTLLPVVFTARAIFLAGDANNDGAFNVADITTMIDRLNGKRLLIGQDSLRADINGDGVLDAKDIDSLRNYILNGVMLVDTGSGISSVKILSKTQLKVVSIESMNRFLKPYSILQAPAMNGTFEVTGNGLRFNLTNAIPITGIQIDARFKQRVQIDQPDLIFNRMHAMNVYVHSMDSTMHIIAYNLNNTPIDTGQGSLFRLPLVLSSTALIDTVHVVLSSAGDTAMYFSAGTSFAAPGSLYPARYELYQNYPNPFNSNTIIRFDIPDLQGRFAKVLIQVFDILGREVKTLYLGDMEAGYGKSVTWDGTNNSGRQVASGVYFYRLISREHMSAKKMIYLK